MVTNITKLFHRKCLARTFTGKACMWAVFLISLIGLSMNLSSISENLNFSRNTTKLVKENKDSLNYQFSQLKCNNPLIAHNETLKRAALDFLTVGQLLYRLENCDKYFDEFIPTLAKFHDDNNEVRSTPLAWSFLLHHQISLFELLLGLVYRKGDSVCVHIDAKARDRDKQAARALVSCYKARYNVTNVLLAEPVIPVFWGHFSVLEAEMRCQRSLLGADDGWKMYLNMPGSTLPILTRMGLEKRLKMFQGSSLIQAMPMPEGNWFRVNKSIIIQR